MSLINKIACYMLMQNLYKQGFLCQTKSTYYIGEKNVFLQSIADFLVYY